MILKILLYVLTYVLHLPKLFKNWFSVRIFRQHLKYDLVKHFNSNSEKFVIIAVFPGTGTFGSLERQIRMFQEHNYNAVVILNKNSKSKNWEDKLINLNCSIIHRNNLGGDFGAYKLGVNHVKKRYNNSISEIVLSNDSMFYTPKSVLALGEFLKDESKFNCLFLHKQSIRHAGSMLLKVDNSILKQEKFWKFWKNYYPYILKKQIVRKGEHKLSQMIGIEYFYPMVNFDISIGKAVDFDTSEAFQALTWGKRSNTYVYDQLDYAFKTLDHKRVLDICISQLQISNSLGLWLARNYELPFKLDLPQYALCTIQDLLDVARSQGCEDQEIYELMQLLSARLNVTEGSIFQNSLRFIDKR